VKTGRLEAFSDGVIAILITIMVLELKVPHGTDLAALRPSLPALATYVLSFVFLGIYWLNHHHLLTTAQRVSGGILWANLHLLFWLSLVPFVTGWVGENSFAEVPVAAYGAVMFMCGIAYLLLQLSILATHGPDSPLRRALGRDYKGRSSGLLYAVGAPLAFVNRWVSLAIYVGVAVMWLIPDRRIEALERE
jgi:uncharacterized membrane protein